MDARTRFLSSAALSYATVAPATAAHLISRFDELPMSNSETSSTDTAIMPCMACGCIDIPGWTSRREMVTRTNSGSQQARCPRNLRKPAVAPRIVPSAFAKSPAAPKVLKMECLLCRSTTESSVRGRDRVKKPMNVDDDRKYEKAAEQNIHRGKRSRTRSKSGLLAILARSKARTTPAPGLDLMDLMKVA